MRTIKRWLSELFDPKEFNALDLEAIGQALNDPSVRLVWMTMLLDMIRDVNLEVDKRLLNHQEFGLTDLAVRRKALQDVLESILSARRLVAREIRPNPPSKVAGVDLDRVTA